MVKANYGRLMKLLFQKGLDQITHLQGRQETEGREKGISPLLFKGHERTLCIGSD